MKKMKKLIHLSDIHNLEVDLKINSGIVEVLVASGNGWLRSFPKAGDKSPTDCIGRAVRAIKAGYANKSKDNELSVEISVRLDNPSQDLVEHQFDSPLELEAVVEKLRLAMNLAYREYDDKPKPYGEWFNRILINVRRYKKDAVYIRTSKSKIFPGEWYTHEEYPGKDGKRAVFQNKIDEEPTVPLLGNFIMNVVNIAELLAERDNPATS